MPERFENKLDEAGVVALMQGSNSSAEWDRNCQIVRKNFNGSFPPFWKQAIIDSGVYKQAQENWAGDYSI